MTLYWDNQRPGRIGFIKKTYIKKSRDTEIRKLGPSPKAENVLFVHAERMMQG
jgi:hypothetical protein